MAMIFDFFFLRGGEDLLGVACADGFEVLWFSAIQTFATKAGSGIYLFVKLAVFWNSTAIGVTRTSNITKHTLNVNRITPSLHRRLSHLNPSASLLPPNHPLRTTPLMGQKLSSPLSSD